MQNITTLMERRESLIELFSPTECRNAFSAQDPNVCPGKGDLTELTSGVILEDFESLQRRFATK